MWHPPFPNISHVVITLFILRFLRSTVNTTFSQPPTTTTSHHRIMTDPGFILFGKKIELPETPNTTNLPPLTTAVEIEKTTCSEEIADTSRLFTPYDQRKDELDDNPKTPSIDEKCMSENLQTTGTSGDTSNLQPKILRKQDKVVPCPRCESMNTKFCYYNNSNINQPRHLCKSCQRYWTAGGSIRNMPVGAGRRKKKRPPPSYCRFIISQEAFESSVNSPKALSFGSNSLHFGANFSNKEKSDYCSSNSVIERTQEFHSQFHWIPWNTVIPIPIPILAVPPMPIYHSPYWNSVSWLPPSGGNHSNEEAKEQKNSVLIPKTLRIDDPDEAAKSSIWATLGIKNENSSRNDLFKGFERKREEKKKDRVTVTELCPALQANPAAFSRSLLFQERA